MPITVDEYFMGRRESYAAYYSPEILDAALDLTARVNKLFRKLNIELAVVTSGWRPPPVNKGAGGAPHSHHITGHAVDVGDRTGAIAKTLLANIAALEECGLYLEDPAHTQGWVHLQDLPPHSQRRVFKP